MDLFDKCKKTEHIDEAISMGIYPYFHALESKQDTEVIIDGHRTIMLGSNNYMGLTSDQRTIDAGIEAMKKYGTGCSGSRFLNGTLVLHEELERKLSSFVNKDDAMTFSTGFQSNLGIISAICSKGDYIISDRENHASIVDGQRLSFAKTVKYLHSDMDDLKRVLETIPLESPKLIITDGVFSMGGDIAKLPDIYDLAQKYNARIMVDDAHGLGMIGDCGRGTANYYGMDNEIDIIMSTFSKSLASLGGFVASRKDVIKYVKHISRPFIFSASIPPANAAVAIKALEILQNEPQRQKQLMDNGNYMREGYRRLGLKIGNSQTAIIPIFTEKSERTFRICKMLLDEGVYVNPVVAPAVPEGECLLRTSYTATHTKEQLDFALSCFEKVFKAI
ncbi:MAG: aminotransferase class I/II-fold pyridoxal phosphate-dependent enzyme [Clostridiales bacterium]|nr:aminotransferase class I/II-fold pyridoxal phosphate-dependent enzyme [Clostridiales bacterium]